MLEKKQTKGTSKKTKFVRERKNIEKKKDENCTTYVIQENIHWS